LDEANNQVLRIERDLTRVRGLRDDLHLELQNRKARENETLQSAREISEIADTGQMRITALEKEVERYKVQLETETVQDGTDVPVAELLRKINVLEKVSCG
jgi:E3 ubiquitin-protein ligase BRE1